MQCQCTPKKPALPEVQEVVLRVEQAAVHLEAQQVAHLAVRLAGQRVARPAVQLAVLQEQQARVQQGPGPQLAQQQLAPSLEVSRYQP